MSAATGVRRVVALWVLVGAVVGAIFSTAGCSSGNAGPAGGASGPVRTGSLTVGRAFVGTHGATSAAAYLEIHNRGDDDALVSVSSPGAAEVAPMGSMSAGADDDAGGDPLPLPIPAGGTLAFTPGGAHLMLMGLDGPLEVGDAVELRLEFDRAPGISVEAEVVNVATIPDLMRR